MGRFDFAAQRLFVEAPLASGVSVTLDRDQTNYLVNVLRLDVGASILIFNGRDGEWLARLEIPRKREALLIVEDMRREQTSAGNVWLFFAPLKHARLDYMVQKAVEMGVARLVPVLTRRTQVHRLNMDRVRANCIEAAEQCGVLWLPEIEEPCSLETVLTGWSSTARLIFCDEDAPVADPLTALSSIGALEGVPVAVLIGPEGGFDDAERTALMQVKGAVAISLGPRILRADTAAVAALAIIQAALGDWRGERK
jgi:16S rRNA (uracil1498-N3)-methyltransferase